MLNSFTPMLFVVLSFVIFQFLFTTLTVNASSIDDDNALAAFVKGRAKFGQFCKEHKVINEQSIQILAQIYGTHLGILYFMKENWNCAKMKGIESSMDRAKECDQFRHCLDNLYEYFYNVHARKSVVKRIILNNFDWTMIALIRVLFHNWKFYFRPDLIKENDPKQVVDVTFSQSLQAFLAKYCQTSGNKASRIEFDNKMEKMFKKLKEQANGSQNDEKLALANASAMFKKLKEQANVSQNDEKLALENATASSSSSSSSSLESDALFLDTLLDLVPVYYIDDAEKDQQFLDFVEKDKLDNFDEKKPNYYLKNWLGLLHLVRKFFRCDNAKRNVKFFDQNQCDKFRLYLDIFHEYLFRLHYGFTKGKPRPIFKLGDEIVAIRHTMETVNWIGAFYFGGGNNNNKIESRSYFPPKIINKFTYHSSLKLLNEEEMDYLDYLKEKDNTQSLFRETVVGLEHAQSPRLYQQRQEFDKILAVFAKEPKPTWDSSWWPKN